MDLDDNFKSQLAAIAEPVLLFFTSEVCGPSYAMQMLVDDLRHEKRVPVEVTEVDIEEHPAIAMHYQLRATPCMMLTQRAKPIASRIGTQTEKEFLEWIKVSLDKLKGRK